MPMNPEIKAAWGEWLRENEGNQGQGALRQETGTGDKVCCLDGPCELAVAAGIVVRTFVPALGRYGYGKPGEEPETGTLPLAVWKWAGLPDNNPMVTSDAGFHSLAQLNDDHGKTFPQLWALIDAQL